MHPPYTDRARKIMQLADQEAKRLNQDCIGTEHLLLGMTKLNQGITVSIFDSLGVCQKDIQKEIDKLIQKNHDRVVMGKLPQTPRLKRVLEYAREEAIKLGHVYIGCEHLLLGLLREKTSLACEVLENLDVNIESVYNFISKLVPPTSQSYHKITMTELKPFGRSDENLLHVRVKHLQEVVKKLIDDQGNISKNAEDILDYIHKITG